MMRVYTERGIINDLTGERLSVGSYVHKFCYFYEDSVRSILNAKLKSVKKDEVVIQLGNSEIRNIPMDAIEGWD